MQDDQPAPKKSCVRCKGIGWYWQTPQGFNPFLAGGFSTARAMRKVECSCRYHVEASKGKDKTDGPV